MAHELTIRKTGTAEMAYVGEKPWHGLGQQLTVGADLETWQRAAGMDWRIKKSKVRYFCDADGLDQREFPQQIVLFRDDTSAPLGIVSPEYKVVQPRTVLEFFRDLIEGNGYQLETAGTLFGGRKFWALAKVSKGFVTAQDEVGSYLLLSTSCDGSTATEARETTVRVVCNNTLSMARYAKADAKISHRSVFDAAQMKIRLGLAEGHFETFLEDARRLSQKRVSNAAAEAFVRELLRPTEASKTSDDFARLMSMPVLLNDVETRAPKGEADILALFRGNVLGQGLTGTTGTAWGLVNSVTAFVDHVKGGKTPDHQLDSALFGTGDTLKTRALDLAMML